MLKNTLTIITMICLFSCSNPKDNSTEKIFWINSSTKHCVGVGPMQCMQIQKGDKMVANAWELFYQKIEGFTFQPGYIYKVKVKEETIAKENLPADASSLKYTLIETLSKEMDKRLRINDIWLIEQIGELDVKGQVNKTIELNVSKMQLSGKAICNSINGSIQKLTETEIEFGSIMSTKMLCPKPEIEANYMDLLSKVKKYKIEKNGLYLMDENNKTLLRYKKVD